MKSTTTILGIVCFSILLTVRPAGADWRISSLGEIIDFSSQGQVLGKSDDASASPGNSATARSRANDENQAENELEEQEEAEMKNTGQDRALEVQTRNQNKVTTNKVVNIKPKGNQIQLQYDDQSQTESELDLDNEDAASPSGEVEIEEHQNKNKIKIRAHENAAVVIQNNTAAKTNFPLMVNLDTNELMVTTPKGTKIVAVLPDAAVRNMLAANVLDQLGGKGGLRWLEYQASLEDDQTATDSADLEDDEATPSGDLETPEESTDSAQPTEEPATPSATITVSPAPEVVETVDDVIELIETEDGRLAYQIEGVKVKKLLGLFDVRLDRTVVVSAETGELLEIIQDFRTRLLDIFSVSTA